MAGMIQVAGGSHTRPGRAKKAVTLAAAFVFLAMMGGAPGAAGQGLNPALDRLGSAESRFPPVAPSAPKKPSEKQKQAMIDYNFKKLKKHAADLAELAKSLQKEIEKSNANVLSLEIVKKADEAEKLAKKIKNEAKGY